MLLVPCFLSRILSELVDNNASFTLPTVGKFLSYLLCHPHLFVPSSCLWSDYNSWSIHLRVKSVEIWGDRYLYFMLVLFVFSYLLLVLDNPSCWFVIDGLESILNYLSFCRHSIILWHAYNELDLKFQNVLAINLPLVWMVYEHYSINWHSNLTP